MKKKEALVSCVLLLAGVIISICGCSRNSSGDDAVKGSYTDSKVAILGGYEFTAEEVEMGNSTLEFDGAGKIKITIENMSETVDYKLEGNQVNFEVEGEACMGTLEGTSLTF